MENKSFEQFARKPRTNYLENPEKYTGSYRGETLFIIFGMPPLCCVLVYLFFLWLGWHLKAPMSHAQSMDIIKILLIAAPGLSLFLGLVLGAAYLYDKYGRSD